MASQPGTRKTNLPVIHRLTDEYLLLIGEAITAWAVLEFELRATVFLTMQIGHKVGRIAVRTPRAREVVEMIDDLTQVLGLKPRTINTKEFADLLDDMESRRNAIAHNVWFLSEGDPPLLQYVTGRWPVEPGASRRASRRMFPGGVPIKADDLKDLVTSIRGAILHAVELRRDIAEQLEALPETHREQSDPRVRHSKPRSAPR